MRWPYPFLALAFSAFGACGIFQPATGAAAGGTAGSDAGADTCDTAGDCADCEQCAVNGPCATEYDACQQSSDCVAIDECVSPEIGDTLSDCEANNPNGVTAYEAAASCEYCTACASACPGMCSE
jgi:hypothetical protein